MRNTTRQSRSVLLRGTSLSALCAIAVSIAGPAFAQEETAESEVTEVVITGSRTIRDGSQAPTPVTVLAIEQLQQSSPKNITEALGSLPAFRNTLTTSTTATSVTSNQAGSFLDLRGLGAERTLVLLDGRRVAPGTTAGAINIDLLPQPLIRRIDVVTGGASAGYGSDAVAGVVNIILDTEFTGVKGTIQGGISDRGDLGSYKFEISAGTRWLDDRLHILASYGQRRSDPVLSVYHREWNRPMGGRITGANVGGASFRTGTVLPNVKFVSYNGGVILASDAVNQAVGFDDLLTTNSTYLKILPGGVVSPYDPGLYYNGTNQQGGDGFVNYPSLASLLEVENTFARATFDVSDNLSVFIQGAASKTHNRYEVSTGSTVQTSAFTIYADNPFIPAYLRTALLAAPSFSATCTTLANGNATTANFQMPAQWLTTGSNLRCFRLNRYNIDFGRYTGDVTGHAHDLVAGFTATIFGDWTLDAYYENGKNKSYTQLINNLDFEGVYTAADVVANPATGGVAGVAAGAPVCRIQLIDPTAFPGCVPLNLFGHNMSSQASYDFASTDGFFTFTHTQQVYAANLTGDAFELPAGPLRIAVGAEYKKLGVRQDSDPRSQLASKFAGNRQYVRGVPAQLRLVPGARSVTNLTPFNGDYTVEEVFTELNIPLLRDLPLVQELSLNAAGRYTNYSTSGEVNTWKVGVSWRPVESLRFRGTISRDIRAPNSQELFQGGSRFQRTFNDPFNGNQPTVAADAAVPDPTLKPEVADTVTAGVVFQPTWLPGVTLTLDYYDIQISGALENLSAQNTLNECFRGSLAICANIKNTTGLPYQGVGTITLVELPFLNLSSQGTAGVDLEIGYRKALEFIPGNFNARLLMGYLIEQTSQVPGGEVLNTVGGVIVQDNPRLRGSLSLGYENGPVGFYANIDWTGHGDYDATLIEGIDLPENRAGSNTTIDLTGRYRFGGEEQYEAFLTINNVLDQPPPFEPNGSVTNFIQTNVNMYDQSGRGYVTGLRFRF